MQIVAHSGTLVSSYLSYRALSFAPARSMRAVSRRRTQARRKALPGGAALNGGGGQEGQREGWARRLCGRGKLCSLEEGLLRCRGAMMFVCDERWVGSVWY